MSEAAAAAAAAAPKAAPAVSEEDQAMLQVLGDSWTEVKGLKEKDKRMEEERKAKEEQQMLMGGGKPAAAAATKSSKSGGGMFGGLFGGGSSSAKKGGAAAASSAGAASPGAQPAGEQGDDDKKTNNRGGAMQDIPRTFDDMVKLNAAMTSANMTWIEIVLDSMDHMVNTVVRGKSLQEEAHVMAMRFNKDARGEIHLREFKVCMLASLRALLPGRWDTAHERAWMWFWENVERQLLPCIPMPKRFERVVNRYVEAMDNNARKEVGLAVWQRMFNKLPQAEGFFKQSNQRLIFIVEAGLDYSAHLYREPTMMVNKLHQLGLKHIMWSVPPEYFDIYVECFIEEVTSRVESEDDMLACEGLGWSLSVIASIMARTVFEGSTPVLKAVVSNDVKLLNKVIGEAPRGTRNQMMLYA